MPSPAILFTGGVSSVGPPVVTGRVGEWWATDLVGAVADGAAVGSWADRSASITLTQTGSNRPTFDVDGVGSRPAVVFDDGSSQWLEVANTITSATTGEVVAVVQYDDLTGANDGGTFWASCDTLSTLEIRGTNAHRWPTMVSDGVGGVQRQELDITDTFQAIGSVPVALEWGVPSAGTYSLAVNNVAAVRQRNLTAAGTVRWFGDVSARDNFTVGATNRNGSVFNYLPGRIAYLLVTDTPLSAGDRSALYSWISTYYSITMTRPTNAYRAAVLTDSPIVYARFDGNETHAGIYPPSDYSGNARHATSDTNAPATVVSGKVYGAYGFDTTEHFTFPNSIFTAMSGTAMSVELWCKPTNFTVARDLCGMDNGGTAAQRSWRLAVDTAGAISFSKVPNGTATATSTATLTAGAWNHVVCTYDGANLRVYVNNSAPVTAATTGSIKGTTTNDFTVGYTGRTSLAKFLGEIDEVAVYSSVLSDARVSAHYAAA